MRAIPMPAPESSQPQASRISTASATSEIKRCRASTTPHIGIVSP
ncbi:hypothetical protein [Sphingobium indicum]|nr:hypothetical protein [Sphingobium indicum]